jgi:RsiW-degrading membrane proteinase PrsW (M82 family)
VTESVEGKTPRRWLGPHGGWWLLLIGGAVLAVYLVLDAVLSPSQTTYRELPTTSIVLGSFLAAVCVFYTMLYRLRPDDGVSIPFLFGAVGIAAFVTTTLAGEANGLIARLTSDNTLVVDGRTVGIASLLFAGPVEETLKALTVLFLGLALETKTFRGGLFVGGAVGLGFAAIENVEYLTSGWEHPLLQLSQLGTLTFVAASRTILTPLLHPIFTSLIGGILFWSARNGRYRLTVPLVGTYFAIVGVHSLWDSAGASVSLLRDRVPLPALGGLGLLVLVVMLGIVIGLPFVWRTVARRANVLAGLRPPTSKHTYLPPSTPLPPGTPPPPPGYRLVEPPKD